MWFFDIIFDIDFLCYRMINIVFFGVLFEKSIIDGE